MSTFIRDGQYMEGDMIYDDIEVPKRPNPTDTWNGTKWVAYQPSLQERKQTLINELETAYDISRYEPIAYLNTTFQADKASQDLITDVLVAAGFTMPLGFMWRDSNNVAILVEGNLLHGLAQAILMRAQPLFWEKSAKKDAINACLTDADLDLYLNTPV